MNHGAAEAPSALSVEGPGQLVVGVDVGGTKALVVAVNAAGEVVGEHRGRSPTGADALLVAVVEGVSELSGRVGSRPTAVGVGVPGLVDREGVLRYAPNLSGVDGLPVRAELEARLGVPVRTENDATCAAWGEHQSGAARGFDDVVLVTLGTGIGAGLVLDGRVYPGAHGFAGEVGHMVIDPHGPPCRCGQRGCWERFASGSGLGRLARDAAHAGRARRIVELAGGDPEDVRGEHVTAAAAEGDEAARELLERFAWWLGLGLANLANIFDPQAFVVGGGLVEAGQLLLDPARAAFDGLVEAAAHRPPVVILPAALGARAGALGAAWLARDPDNSS